MKSNRSSAAACCRGAVLAASLAAAAMPAQEATDAVAATRTTVEKWVETRNLVSKELRDWKLGKEALEARSALMQREIESLQARIKETEAGLVDTDRKRGELMAKNELRKASSEQLTKRIAALEAKLVQTLPRLPEPLRDRVKPLSQRLPRNGEESKLSLGDRWANVVGVLNEVDKWNREITVTTEVRALSDGQSVEVTVIYLGLGQAFYASAGGKVAGSGTAAAEGWQWKAQNELAPQVLRAIGIWKSEQVAAFVMLPVQIQ